MFSVGIILNAQVVVHEFRAGAASRGMTRYIAHS